MYTYNTNIMTDYIRSHILIVNNVALIVRTMPGMPVIIHEMVIIQHCRLEI